MYYLYAYKILKYMYCFYEHVPYTYIPPSRLAVTHLYYSRFQYKQGLRYTAE